MLGGAQFSLCCTPAFILFALGFLSLAILVAVLTVAPAWTALLATQFSLLAQTRRLAFLQALRKSGRLSVQCGLLASLPFISARVLLPALSVSPVSLATWLTLGIIFFAMALALAVSLYAFPLLAYGENRLLTTLRNAWILAVRYPSHTLGLMSMAILFAFGVAYVSLGLLFLLPTVYGMFVAANCLYVLALEGQESPLIR